jgi:hypothetical protein
MFPNMNRALCASLVAILTITAGSASAQWYGNPCQSYCAQPVACVRPVVCARPVAQTCYQTVPVTEYQRVKQTVKRPVCETTYVEKPVTEYRPVVETKTVEVPTVSYQNVTECQTVTRNCGYWQTRYACREKVSSCAYDGRPDVFGMMNRTAYSIRSAFTPSMVASREYVPNTVVQTVPVTRQVAVRSTRTQTYQVTRMVPVQTKRKVAVNTIRYVDEEVVALKPVTVMRTVPVGTRTAYTFGPTYPTAAPQPATALRPTPDPVSNARSEKADAPRSARKGDRFDDSARSSRSNKIPAKPSSLTTPILPNPTGHQTPDVLRASNEAPHSSRSVPSIVRVNRWRPTRTADSRPLTPSPAIAVARN